MKKKKQIKIKHIVSDKNGKVLFETVGYLPEKLAKELLNP